MGRMTDWAHRLAVYMNECQERQMKPGEHDCALFAAGAVLAMTGDDPAAKWRGHYQTFSGGARLLKREGYSDHIEFVAENYREVPVEVAAPGDIAVVKTAVGPALGIIQGASIYVLGETGVGLVPREDACRAFEVL